MDPDDQEAARLRTELMHEVQWAPDPLRVILCDDHALYRRALLVALEQSGQVEVVAESDSGPEAAALVQEMAPDAVLVDLALPPYGGVAAVSQMSRLAPGTRILLMAANERSPETLLEALGAGADGVVLKEVALDEAGPLLDELVKRRCPISRILASLIQVAVENHDPALAPMLSEREAFVVDVVARGESLASGARSLGISEDTAHSLIVGAVRKTQRSWRRDEILRSWSDFTADPSDTAELARRLVYQLA